MNTFNYFYFFGNVCFPIFFAYIVYIYNGNGLFLST